MTLSLPPARTLLDWYRAHRRHLPWRAPPGVLADPYHVFLSEIMLQQTVVAAVIPYYTKFLAAYPLVADLAAAPVEEVMGMWAGLGYYSRARNLHACAKVVAGLGGFPRDVAALQALPGIGPYTAAAIAALAFGVPVLAVDGNIERVASRLFAVAAPLPGGKKVLGQAARRLMEDEDAQAAPGDFTQALFDLGATICTPRKPACGICPWLGHCAAQSAGIAETLPARSPKAKRPHRTGVAYVLLDKAGNVFLRRRPPRGLLGGMLEVPEAPPLAADWIAAGSIEHVFTHFSLTLSVFAARCAALPPGGEVAPAASVGLPTVMRKALDAGCRALKDSA